MSNDTLLKIGLIARNEIGRGLAIQTHSFYENMPISKVLLVHMPNRRQEAGVDWYKEPIEAHLDDVTHTLPHDVQVEFLKGLDVVFTAETPYDFSMLDLAREMGVKSVIQGNPEFYKHDRPHGPTQQPDAWWWPSGWRRHCLPAGPLMPCPQEQRGFEPVAHGGPLRVLHSIGRRASQDRNGTAIFIQAIRNCREPLEVTMTSMDGEFAHEIPQQANVTWNLHPNGLKDRWQAYRGQDLLVLPRRYGGNCLPALEAAACGLAVIMPNIEPNGEYTQLLTSIASTSVASFPCGPTPVHEPDAYSLAATIDLLAHNRTMLAGAQQQSYENCPRWSDWREIYLHELRKLCDKAG